MRLHSVVPVIWLSHEAVHGCSDLVTASPLQDKLMTMTCVRSWWISIWIPSKESAFTERMRTALLTIRPKSRGDIRRLLNAVSSSSCSCFQLSGAIVCERGQTVSTTESTTTDTDADKLVSVCRSFLYVTLSSGQTVEGVQRPCLMQQREHACATRPPPQLLQRRALAAAHPPHAASDTAAAEWGRRPQR